MLELKGKPVADSIYEKLSADLLNWKKKGWSLPHLVVLLVGEDSASQVYVERKRQACEKLGFQSTLLKFKKDVTEIQLLFEIDRLNQDHSVDGILLQLPLPSHLDAKKITNQIHVTKDVDGITAQSLGLLVSGQQTVASCTPSGIMAMLDFYKLDVAHKNALVIGRSLIVGMPLFHLLNQRQATVTLAHSQTHGLRHLLKNFEFVFVAIGQPHFFKAADFHKGSVLFDVGIHRLDSGLIGDVDLSEGVDHLRAATPVPGGVGPMTIAMLMHNTFVLALARRK